MDGCSTALDILFLYADCPSFVFLPDNVQVKYRSKVVKYIWPMPHQAESIPWVQIKLANGGTLQTKLLVSLSFTHKHTHTQLLLIRHSPLLYWFFGRFL